MSSSTALSTSNVAAVVGDARPAVAAERGELAQVDGLALVDEPVDVAAVEVPDLAAAGDVDADDEVGVEEGLGQVLDEALPRADGVGMRTLTRAWSSTSPAS